MRDNEKSRYYYKNAIPTWEAAGYEVEIIDAITPANMMQKWSDLKFKEHVQSRKYLRRKLRKVFSATERACVCSYFEILQEAYFKKEDVVILEHDAALLDADKFAELFSQRKNYDAMCFGIAVEASYISAEMVTDLFEYYVIQGNPISVGPMGTIVGHGIERYNDINKYKIYLGHKNQPVCVNQFFNPDIGRTIDHYEGQPELAKRFEEMERQTEAGLKWIRN